jgi:hypothetical protein
VNHPKGGKSWLDKDQVVVSNEGLFYVMPASLLRLKSGQIALFYLRKSSLQDCRPMLRLSDDEAKTWRSTSRRKWATMCTAAQGRGLPCANLAQPISIVQDLCKAMVHLAQRRLKIGTKALSRVES